MRLVGGDGDDAARVVPGLGLTYARDHGQPYGRFLVEQDQRRIASHYVRHGYFAAEVAAAIDRRGAAVDVTFTVQRGPRARLARVDVLGLPPEAAGLAAELRALVPIADGAPFDHPTWEAAGPTLPARLHAVGYARATVQAMVLADRARAEAVIRLVVTLGPQARFGAVDVRGVPAGLEGAVAARLRVRAGAPYRPAALEAFSSRALCTAARSRRTEASPWVEIPGGKLLAVGDWTAFTNFRRPDRERGGRAGISAPFKGSVGRNARRRPRDTYGSRDSVLVHSAPVSSQAATSAVLIHTAFSVLMASEDRPTPRNLTETPSPSASWPVSAQLSPRALAASRSFSS